MKTKPVALMLASALVLIVTACGGPGGAAAPTQANPTTSAIQTTPATTAVQTTTPTAPPGTTALVTAPGIPHQVTGLFVECLRCHASGSTLIKQVPANHAGRTNSMCRGCHQVKIIDD